MSKYHNAFQGFVKLFTGAKQPGVKGSSTTIIGVAPSKNIKKFQEQKEKIIKTTDAYKKKVNDPEVKKKMNETTSKTLGKISQILKGKKVEKKAMGGRIGYKSGSKDYKDRDAGGGADSGKRGEAKSRMGVLINKANRRIRNSKLPESPMKEERIFNTKNERLSKIIGKENVGPGYGREVERPTKKAMGGRIGRKFGSPNPRKTNVEKIKQTFGPKKNVPSKLKGFSKLPEKVQQQMNKKLARKV